ncbi:hypothetical protein C5167_012372 [Papaver somniferum]|uniref:Uncharacterized protein n=1 Tax=Papaver somniferum TaxID=3469 RepID=A0A4Y7J0D1_PAPSO|nr:hypothetical protein C5167_012372 [Papaver somniferum]
MAKLEYEKQLIDDQAKEEEVKAYESVKSVKDVGIDPIQESPESPSQWPLEFERKQRYIIELWHFCCISLAQTVIPLALDWIIKWLSPKILLIQVSSKTGLYDSQPLVQVH